ncbi:BamA/TamA family outer membrane protein [Labilibaculum sp. DW002]|uniref:BamA/TamA family outer membrane protein n=1 Tax=Paralabilibaculum antarcticum TaxID=2912572 RepID=A0ABT5VPC3_9BACT|nr:BamA/TamA family outer membrane protein [Labilibaculum sp. DW002]MDE5417137.1 BamA/TamA family outer membrane protein [Labilibaculum sp. DW002]
MKRIIIIYICVLLSAAAVFAQKKDLTQKPSQVLLDHSIFFVGDIGEGPIIDANIDMLKRQMNEVNEKGTVVFLGNSISKEYAKETVEEIDSGDPHLVSLLNSVKDFSGELIFIPGEKEWNQGRKHGWEALMNLETFVEDYLDRGDVFLPSGGCPGPIEIDLTDEVVLLIVDSQWWLHLGDKPEAECGLENTSDFLILLSDAIKRNKNKKIVFASHHPVYSAGNHGGNFAFPGPVELYRKLFGTPQDFAYPFYKQMRYMARKIGVGHDNLISVSAHDNSLQFAKKDGSFFIVSGSGSKSEYVSQKKMDVALREVGFTRLNFYSNNEVWLEFWTVGENGNKEEHLAYREKLYTKDVPTAEDLLEKYKEICFSDSTITIAASQLYKTDSKLKLKFFGTNYRREWETPIQVPVFDIGKEKGGLKIIKRGGGQQTRSLRLEAKDGKQYVLRSVEKYTEKAIPAGLQGTLAAKIVQDGISESYPYAALAVPKMANAVGVYHTNPKIVYVPDDPRLGIYQDNFKNELFLFEERPKGDMSGWDNFGNSKSILSTDKLLAKRFKNSDLRIDETAVLRARLFDIFLNDWDRHDDQWRWASFEREGKIIAKPIPRDRDQVFFYSDGVIPKVMRRKWLIPKFQVFDSIVENVVGLGFNARYFDRNFLQSKVKEDWIAMAEELKSKLSDEVIEESVKGLPIEVYEISGLEITAKLKARREQLTDLAEEFYSFLAKDVDVVGTNDQEQFDINWLADGRLKVETHRLSKKGNKKDLLYSRTFKKEETNEVRIFGLDGKDRFELKGNKENGIKLRIIGGKGKDKFKLKDTKRRNLSLYDKKKTNIKGKGQFKNKLGKSSEVNNYDRKSFKYDVVSPGVNLNFVSDDGLILGAGVNVKKQGYNKEPYGALHKFIANYAFAYPSVEVKYSGEFREVYRKTDFLTDVHYNTPNFQGYYYGLGNETKNIKSDDDRYNRIRMARFEFNSSFRRWLGKNHSIAIGAFYQQLKLKATPDRFVTDFSNLDNNLNSLTDFSTRKYVGLKVSYLWDSRDNKIVPSRGIYWSSSWKYYNGLKDNDRDFQKMETDLRMYLSFGRPQRTILAMRFGAAHNTKGYSFAQANRLGIKSNLRGYRQERFAGDDMVYQNTDLRLRLARFKSYLLNGEFGILGFNDFGRVWVEDEKSNEWHHGYGGGFWLTPYKLMVVTANFSHSVEDDIFSIEFKYMF